MSQSEGKKQRLIMIDLIRIICALLIYGRHSITMFGCTYGNMADTVIISLTSPVMTCFFVLSGFSLYYSYRKKKITDSLLSFYGKRILTILPSYYLIHLLWLAFNVSKVRDWLILTPIELVGIQSTYNSLFGILHNGGTWFVSCMLICYAVYPVMQEFLKGIGLKWKMACIVIVYFLMMYSVTIVDRFGLAGNYSNPFFRLMEFFIGAGIASVLLNETTKSCMRGGYRTICNSALIIILFVFLNRVVRVPAGTVITTYLPIPVIAVILWTALKMKLPENRMVSVLSAISYHFYLMQMILWDVSNDVLKWVQLSGNIWKITVSLTLCTTLAYVMYKCFDKPIQKAIIRKWG